MLHPGKTGIYFHKVNTVCVFHYILTQVEKLANTVSKLAVMSKEADNIVKGCRHWENITMNNEAEIEDTDKATRNAKKIGKTRFFLSSVNCATV